MGDEREVISSDEQILTNNPKDSTRLEKYRVLVTRLSAVKQVYTLAIRRLQDSDTGAYECYMFIMGEPSANYPRALGEMVVQREYPTKFSFTALYEVMHSYGKLSHQ